MVEQLQKAYTAKVYRALIGRNKDLSAPVTTASMPWWLIAAATMSSHSIVDGIASHRSSQAVRRAPWLYGRVSVK